MKSYQVKQVDIFTTRPLCGHEVGSDGFVHIAVSMSDRTIQLGGASVTCVEGRLRG
jgi:predicted PhzF superfamily epimerase YddE/YHI9